MPRKREFDPVRFGRHFQELLDRSRYNQREIAPKIGVHYPSISRWVNGHLKEPPRVESLEGLDEHLRDRFTGHRANVNYLLYGELPRYYVVAPELDRKVREVALSGEHTLPATAALFDLPIATVVAIVSLDVPRETEARSPSDAARAVTEAEEKRLTENEAEGGEGGHRKAK